MRLKLETRSGLCTSWSWTMSSIPGPSAASTPSTEPDRPAQDSREFFFLPAATKLGKGNIFTGVCLSTGVGCLPQCMLGYTPPEQDPPRADTPPPGKQTSAYGQWAAGSLICTWLRNMCYTFPDINIWYNSCWPLGSHHDNWAILFHIPSSKHWWGLKLWSIVLQMNTLSTELCHLGCKWEFTKGPSIHTCNLLGTNYCMNYSLNNGVYCIQRIHTCDLVNFWTEKFTNGFFLFTKKFMPYKSRCKWTINRSWLFHCLT